MPRKRKRERVDPSSSESDDTAPAKKKGKEDAEYEGEPPPAGTSKELPRRDDEAALTVGEKRRRLKGAYSSGGKEEAEPGVIEEDPFGDEGKAPGRSDGDPYTNPAWNLGLQPDHTLAVEWLERMWTNPNDVPKDWREVLPQWDPATLLEMDSPTILMTGKRRVGKSFMTRWLLYWMKHKV